MLKKHISSMFTTSVTSFKGTISAFVDKKYVEPFLQHVPEHAQLNQQARDNNQYHLTICSADENIKLNPP